MNLLTRAFRYFLVLVVPFLLMILEIWHPIGFKNDVFNQLLPQIDWWIVLYVLQLPLFALLGTGVYFQIIGLKSFPATVSRIAIWLFVVYYICFNGIDGIGTGVLIDNARELTPDEQAPIAHAVQLYFNDPIFGGTHSWMSEFASLAWLIGIITAAWALFLAGNPILPLIFLILSGIFLWNTHSYPYGPIAFACLFLGNALLEIWPKPIRKNQIQFDI